MKAEWGLLLLLAAGSAEGARLAAPPAEELALKAFAPPPVSWAGEERAQFLQAGGRSRSLRARTWNRADGARRRELLKGRKPAPAMIELRAGGERRVLFKDALWAGPDRSEPAAATLARLKSLYSLSSRAGPSVAKRKTWRLDLRAGGTLRASLFTDRETGILLKREDYGPDGRTVRRWRVTRLVLGADPPPEAFVLEPGTPASPGARTWLPEGFLPVGPDAYGDGVRVLRLAGGKAEGPLAPDELARIREGLE